MCHPGAQFVNEYQRHGYSYKRRHNKCPDSWLKWPYYCEIVIDSTRSPAKKMNIIWSNCSQELIFDIFEWVLVHTSNHAEIYVSFIGLQEKLLIASTWNSNRVHTKSAPCLKLLATTIVDSNLSSCSRILMILMFVPSKWPSLVNRKCGGIPICVTRRFLFL